MNDVRIKDYKLGEARFEFNINCKNIMLTLKTHQPQQNIH